VTDLESGLLTVGAVARVAGVTVRTLHHYDAVGLVSPSGRTHAGYRLYAPADLDRLHAVLAYRELGFGLDEIAALLTGDADPLTHLRRQHQLVRTRIDHLTRLLGALEKTMEAQMSGLNLTPEERFEVFGEHDPEEHADEARDRWGDTDAYRQSQQRTARYTKDDWLRIKAEAEGVTQRFAELFAAGAPADGPDAAAAVRAHRDHITRWFYDLPPEGQRGLAAMYVEDDRFRRHYDDRAPGLAQYVHDAITSETAAG
jgi:DNA-binding transcriptional MerR regulator